MAPVRPHSDGQRLIISQNLAVGSPYIFPPTSHPLLFTVPNGRRKGAILAADQTFLQSSARLPHRVFDARRDFAARGDGVTDDTTALQKTIDAAATASSDAMAYLPAGTYAVTRTLHITGHDYFVGGSGWSTRLVWTGPEKGVMVEVRDPQHVVLQDMMIGSHDAGAMNNALDVHQIGSGKRSYMTYDGVYVYGMYQKQPERKGLQFSGLGAKDIVVMPHVQGNLRFVDCSDATILANCTYEGSIVVQGKGKGRGGLLGFQTRLATGVTYGLYLRNNQSIVMSDFYTEGADNGFYFAGAPDDPPGRATIQGAKVHFFTSDDPAKNTAFNILGYRGEIFFGPDQFYGEPKKMRIRQEGAGPLELFLLGCSWYGPAPDVQMSAAARTAFIGNEAYGSGPNGEPPQDKAFTSEAPTDSTLAHLSRALDDLRRLGEWDLKLNHPTPLPAAAAK